MIFSYSITVDEVSNLNDDAKQLPDINAQFGAA